MIVEYHKTRSVLDFVFINKIFEADERELLHRAQEKISKCYSTYA